MILLADHAQTPVHRGLPLAELLGREWSVLQPSDDRPELAQLAVSPTGRAAHVYLLPGRGSGPSPGGGRRQAGRDRGRRPGLPAGGRRRPSRCAARSRGCRRRAASGRWSSGVGSACAFAPATASPTCAAAAGRSRASSRCWRRRSRTAGCAATTYPDPLARVWSALTAPHCRRLHRLARARLRGGRLGRSHPRRRRQPRRPARRRLARPAALRRLRPGVRRRARAVDAAGRGAGGARALRAGRRLMPRGGSWLLGRASVSGSLAPAIRAVPPPTAVGR